MADRDRAAEEAATRGEAEAVAGEIGLLFGQPDAVIQMEYVWLDDEPEQPGWWRLTWDAGPERWADVFFHAAVVDEAIPVVPSLEFDIEDSDYRVLTVLPALSLWERGTPVIANDESRNDGPADKVEGSIWSPRDLVSPPVYEGPLSQAHTKLTPGRYTATDQNDNPVVVGVTETTSSVTPVERNHLPNPGPTPGHAVADLAEELNDENTLLNIAYGVRCEVVEALAVVLDAHAEPVLAAFLRRIHRDQPQCVMDHNTGEIPGPDHRRRNRCAVRPPKN